MQGPRAGEAGEEAATGGGREWNETVMFENVLFENAFCLKTCSTSTPGPQSRELDFETPGERGQRRHCLSIPRLVNAGTQFATHIF